MHIWMRIGNLAHDIILANVFTERCCDIIKHIDCEICETVNDRMPPRPTASPDPVNRMISLTIAHARDVTHMQVIERRISVTGL